MESIREKAMLVKVTVHFWNGMKFDKEVTHKTAEVFEADPFKAGKYNKMLVDRDELDSLTKLINAARSFHYYHTLPWMDEGYRILPAENYFSYLSGMNSIIDEFNSEVNKFLEKYPSLIEKAKSTLKKMYNQWDYPSVEDLRRRFRIQVDFLPIPDTEDFRVKLSDEEIKSIKNNLQERLNESIKEAQLSLWKRLSALINRIVERLSDENSIIRESLIGNIQELVEVIPNLNIVNDRELIDLVDEVKKDILVYSSEDLRSSKTIRKKILEKAKVIENKINTKLRG